MSNSKRGTRAHAEKLLVTALRCLRPGDMAMPWREVSPGFRVACDRCAHRGRAWSAMVGGESVGPLCVTHVVQHERAVLGLDPMPEGRP